MTLEEIIQELRAMQEDLAELIDRLDASQREFETIKREEEYAGL